MENGPMQKRTYKRAKKEKEAIVLGPVKKYKRYFYCKIKHNQYRVLDKNGWFTVKDIDGTVKEVKAFINTIVGKT
jgi:hypothetical protein